MISEPALLPGAARGPEGLSVPELQCLLGVGASAGIPSGEDRDQFFVVTTPVCSLALPPAQLAPPT